MMTTNSPVFTPAQIEILNAVSHLKTEEEIKELQQAISHFFFLRAEKEMDRLWDQGVRNEKTLEDLRTAHYRTPYITE